MSAAITNKPDESGYALFETPIGRCGIAWRGGRIVRSALPQATPARFPGMAQAEPPASVAAAIDAIVGLLSGQPADLSTIGIDLSGAAEFDRAVYAAASRIPRGEVRTYGEIASEIGQPRAAQAVGLALGRNPVPIIVPCHRVLAASGRSGGFSAPGGIATKFRILEIEGARRSGPPELFDALPLAVKPA
jgi:methylated-DNA-[protein]-cysteine S-methyltransferase